MCLPKRYLKGWIFLSLGLPSFAFCSTQGALTLLQPPSCIQGHLPYQISLFANKKKGIEEVLFQVDEKNAQGDYVLDQGIPYTKDSDDPFVDLNDEIVVETQAFGAPLLDWKKKGFVCELTNPGDPEEFLYVRKGSSKLDVQPRVLYKKDRIQSSQYRFYLSSGHPILPNSVSVAGENFIHRGGFLLPLRVMFLPETHFAKDDFKSEVESWKTGPLRTILAFGIRFTGWMSWFRFHFFSEVVFHEFGFSIPTLLEFPVSPKKYLRQGSGIVYGLDFAKENGLQIQHDMPELVSINQDSPGTRKKEQYTVRGFYGKKEWSLDISVDASAAQKAETPKFFSKKSLSQASEAKKEYPWLNSFDFDVGIFTDFSALEDGFYSFNLDFEFVPKTPTEAVQVFSKKE